MKKGYSKTIIVLGRSGSGKDTQARLLAKKFGYAVFATGDALRETAKKPTFLGKRLRRELKLGHLAPTWLASFLWINMLIRSDPSRGIIFNGSPRKLSEAKFLNEVLSWLGRRAPCVFLVDVGEREALLRLTKRRICTRCAFVVPYVDEFKFWSRCRKCGGLLRGRPDDRVRAIRTRFLWFKKEVEPVIRFYKKQGLLERVDGEQPIEVVFNDLLKAL